MIMSDRFDFEQQIIKCWGVTDDINDLSESVMNNDLRKDTIVNALNGLNTMYELKFNKLWDLFEDVVMKLVRDEKMAREDADALREQLIFETLGASGKPKDSVTGQPTRFGQLDTQGFGIAAMIPNKKTK